MGGGQIPLGLARQIENIEMRTAANNTRKKCSYRREMLAGQKLLAVLLRKRQPASL